MCGKSGSQPRPGPACANRICQGNPERAVVRALPARLSSCPSLGREGAHFHGNAAPFAAKRRAYCILASARLLCLHGLLDLKDAQLDRAYELFTKAIQADPSLADAWANRATVRFQRGDLDNAIADLTHALRLGEGADSFYNRGGIFEAQEKWTEAIQDYSRALGLAGGEASHIRCHLDLCRRAVRQSVPSSLG